ncbi:O-antigen ligase family protein [Ruoffia tabacinasalis]|uniref:O-antigen ligase family protein n=1 Tax=Ruoffia tabacinasalis TaxID=87458 RepID=A0ABS0LLW8_9LACT|nr:O-antigen ligase family protein [Ruoffia tabacinasalis]MBG9979290.1 O-antigen ligase family protein [Ruoffia tabacinasalis]
MLLAVIIFYNLVTFRVNLEFNHTFFLMTLFLIIQLIGPLKVGRLYEGANNFILSLIVGYLIYLSLSKLRLINDNEFLIKLIFIANFFVFIGNIIQFISPELLKTINSIHLSDTHLLMNNNFLENNVLIGFTHNTGVNAIVIFINQFFVFISILKSNKFLKSKIVIFFLLYYLIFLTQRRGVLLFSIIIFVYLFFLLNKIKPKYILISFFVLSIFYYMLFYTAPGNDILIRTFESNDITTGRTSLYNLMINNFKNNPILGTGVFSTISFLPTYHGHNVYLEVLSDYGVLGFIPFVLIILINIYNNHIAIVRTKNNILKLSYVFTIGLQLLFALLCLLEIPLYENYMLILYVIILALFRNINFIEKKEKNNI